MYLDILTQFVPLLGHGEYDWLIRDEVFVKSTSLRIRVISIPSRYLQNLVVSTHPATSYRTSLSTYPIRSLYH
jgi:hypothetical protein